MMDVGQQLLIIFMASGVVFGLFVLFPWVLDTSKEDFARQVGEHHASIQELTASLDLIENSNLDELLLLKLGETNLTPDRFWRAIAIRQQKCLEVLADDVAHKMKNDKQFAQQIVNLSPHALGLVLLKCKEIPTEIQKLHKLKWTL